MLQHICSQTGTATSSLVNKVTDVQQRYSFDINLCVFYRFLGHETSCFVVCFDKKPHVLWCFMTLNVMLYGVPLT